MFLPVRFCRVSSSLIFIWRNKCKTLQLATWNREKPIIISYLPGLYLSFSFVTVTNLRWRESASTRRTLWKHPLSAATAAFAEGRRVLHGPVASLKQVCYALGDFLEGPLWFNWRTRGIPGTQHVYTQLHVHQCLSTMSLVIFLFQHLVNCHELTGNVHHPCSEFQIPVFPSELLVVCWCDDFQVGRCYKDREIVFLDHEILTEGSLLNLSSHLMKVNCSPYMLGSSSRLGYFPKGGTIRLNTRAMQTNTAGRTICKNTIMIS